MHQGPGFFPLTAGLLNSVPVQLWAGTCLGPRVVNISSTSYRVAGLLFTLLKMKMMILLSKAAKKHQTEIK
jgi:hypothetical protein